ncbi:MAG: VanW family protein [Coriobacteriales bacterium]|nr:VanW family protein [Coriobacteriales bacterium]MBQ6586569.1 VanW family protein [Coriobacteriales bacterium]
MPATENDRSKANGTSRNGSRRTVKSSASKASSRSLISSSSSSNSHSSRYSGGVRSGSTGGGSKSAATKKTSAKNASSGDKGGKTASKSASAASSKRKDLSKLKRSGSSGKTTTSKTTKAKTTTAKATSSADSAPKRSHAAKHSTRSKVAASNKAAARKAAIASSKQASGKTSTRKDLASKTRSANTDGVRRRHPARKEHGISKAKKPLIIVFSVLLGLGVLVGLDVLGSKGSIHRGVTVAGIEVGGMTVDEAAELLQDELSSRLEDASVTVYADDDARIAHEAGFDASETCVYWSITPETIGAYIDGQRLAQEAYDIGRDGRTFLLRFKAWLGGVETNPTVDYDEAAMDDVMGVINDHLGTPMIDANVVIEDGEVSCTPASDGFLLVQNEFIQSVSNAFLQGAPSFIAHLDTVHHTTTDEQAQELAESITRDIAEPVTLTYEGESWELGPAELGACLTVTRQKGAFGGYELGVEVDKDKCEAVLKSHMGDDVILKAKDAYFVPDVDSGYIYIEPSVNGIGPDVSTAAALLQNILFTVPAEGEEPPARVINLLATSLEADFTTQDAQDMGIVEVVGTYTTRFGGSDAKAHNIRTLCALLDNTFVEPGEVWSFHATVGECNEEKGFQAAGSIVDGVYTTEIGGGICQVATTLFNAIFESGLPIEERVNHSLYLSNYPTGRDCTVSYPSPDLKFINDTDHWLLISVKCEGNYVTATIWGTSPGYSVEAETSDWYVDAPYSTTTIKDDSMYEDERKVTQEGRDAMTIYVTRYVYDSDGELVRKATFTSKYKSINEVVHVGTKVREPEPEPEPSDGGDVSAGDADSDAGSE